MTEREAFIWYELMTTDAAAAAAFYGAVVGWSIPTASTPDAEGRDYRMIVRSDGGANGGVLQLSSGMQAQGAKAMWLPYFYVENIDDAVAAIAADGGEVMLPRMELPVGVIAMLTDPMGAPFYVMTPIPPADEPLARSDVFHRDSPERVGWNELASSDLARARAFYAKHFGFGIERTMPMGELGDYVFLDVGDEMQGGLMARSPESRARGWVPYFNVRSTSLAQRTIEQRGGEVLMPMHEVPGGRFVVLAADPEGAVFGVTGPKGA